LKKPLPYAYDVNNANNVNTVEPQEEGLSEFANLHGLRCE